MWFLLEVNYLEVGICLSHKLSREWTGFEEIGPNSNGIGLLKSKTLSSSDSKLFRETLFVGGEPNDKLKWKQAGISLVKVKALRWKVARRRGPETLPRRDPGLQATGPVCTGPRAAGRRSATHSRADCAGDAAREGGFPGNERQMAVLVLLLGDLLSTA